MLSIAALLVILIDMPVDIYKTNIYHQISNFSKNLRIFVLHERQHFTRTRLKL
jgi:hypothetical protein